MREPHDAYRLPDHMSTLNLGSVANFVAGDI